ncbi:MAG TPA: septal ring lytic transglycosylase RlpA family protein [Thermoanaerobaculia bacterium]|nr:septal ring lytic transglycosylase RlpA family protein [Thermoanaerobaculia bacterium]
MNFRATTALGALLLAAPMLEAENALRPEAFAPAQPLMGCYEHVAPVRAHDPLFQRILKYTQVAVKHRVAGLASYYSGFFDGRKTANGEIFRNGRFSAAHLTLPLGTWVEVKSRATGKKLRMRVNDRGPYVKKFCLDLSQAAARFLGVDVARDRYVDIRIIALPGEEPLPEDVDYAQFEPHVEAATSTAAMATTAQ